MAVQKLIRCQIAKIIQRRAQTAAFANFHKGPERHTINRAIFVKERRIGRQFRHAAIPP